MNDHHDLEKKMKTYEAGPGPEVKATVMAKFWEMNRERNSRVEHIGFWKRPIPLYAATLLMVVVVALSFITGQKSSQISVIKDVSQDSFEGQDSTAAQVLTWRAAQRDIL